VKTVMGRHIRFPQGMYTHKAGGLVFQGTSADCMKQKMVELWPYCANNGIKMLLSVHDELDFSIPESGAEERATDIKQQLEVFDGSERHPIFCRVPIRSQVELANNWFDASK
jgi:DNA polymerase I-like protein with 3'-5' exonuclease and polymerase domains